MSAPAQRTNALHNLMNRPATGVALVGVNTVAAGYNVGAAVLTGSLLSGALALFNILAAVLCAWSYRRLHVARERLAELHAAEPHIEDLERQLDGAWAALAKTVETPRKEDRKLASEHFEAYTYCPHCGKAAVHGIRPARHGISEDDMERALDRLQSSLRRSTYIVWGEPSPPELNLWDEVNFEVVRTCGCGAEWGQR